MDKFEGESYWLDKLSDIEREELISICGLDSRNVHHDSFASYIVFKFKHLNNIPQGALMKWTNIIERISANLNKDYNTEIEYKIKSASFDNSVDYKPMVDTLEPNKYFEIGYYRGQKDLIKILLDSGLISGEKLNELL